MDLGLWALGLACLAIAGGMLALRVSGGQWRMSAFATTTMGIEVAVVATVNQYAGTERAGANVHTWAVALLYLSFAAAALTSRPGLEELGSSAAGYSRAAGWVWIVLAPIYYFWYPSGWAGLFERAIALLISSGCSRSPPGCAEIAASRPEQPETAARESRSGSRRLRPAHACGDNGCSHMAPPPELFREEAARLGTRKPEEQIMKSIASPRLRSPGRPERPRLRR